MDSNYVTKVQFNEYTKRMEDEHDRQNARIRKLEERSEKDKEVLITIQKLADNMDVMSKEQVKQGERLEVLEGRDGEMWRTAMKYVLSGLVGAALAFMLPI